jgi:serine/threonine protein kinase
MPIAPGARLGSYDVTALLGAGGMGEVYRARDRRLKREVAIKVLPEAFARDAERLARFEREAQALASLNHPNIGSIYELAQIQSSHFLVLELVEGQTLADRLAHGSIALPEALGIARQIIEALDAAHEKGIVHRDLKPGNVMLTSDGGVKVLDFGLAKLTTGEAIGTDGVGLTNSPTAMASMAGTILGTASYMSPEQAKGKSVDKRADIWAFGVVLYEMVTGRRLFQGETLQETLAAVIKDEPDLVNVPSQVQPLLRQCLAKDPKHRLRDVGDAVLLLDDAPRARAASARRAWPWPVAAGGLGLMAALALWAPWRTPPVPEVSRFQVTLPEGTDFGGILSLSPDGRKLALVATGQDLQKRLWIRDMNSLLAVPLPGSEIKSPIGGSMSWSPDSRAMVFTDENRLMKVEVSGSNVPVTIARLPALGGEPSWNSEGVILIGGITQGPIWRVPDSGGDVKAVTALKGTAVVHALPAFLPDGRHFLYWSYSPVDSAAESGVYVGSLDVGPEDQSSNRLLASDSQVVYVSSPASGTGKLLFVRGGRLLAQSFDAKKLTLTDEPVMVAPTIGGLGARASFTASNNGTLAYRGEREFDFRWFDRAGRVLNRVAEATGATFARVSPDGMRVAFDRVDEAGGVDIWLAEMARGVTTRLTLHAARDEFPIWSPDGNRILFRSNRSGVFDLYERATDGAGDDRLVLHTGLEKWPDDWSRDGRYILYEERSIETRDDLWLLPMDGDRTPIALVRSPFTETFGQFSPDGRWIAFQSDRSGRDEVYLRPFVTPGTNATTAPVYQVSRDGGARPVWREDGKELVYIGPNRMITAVEVTTNSRGQTGAPQRLFQMPIDFPGFIRLEMDPGGQRFLLRAPVSDAARSPITIVMNWQAALRR